MRPILGNDQLQLGEAAAPQPRVARNVLRPREKAGQPVAAADGCRIGTRRENIVGKRLYVGNLGYSTTSAELENMFKPYGKVESAIMVEDRDNGRSKGFGFVEMSSDTEAQAAMSALNGTQNEGRTLKVNEAKAREERGGARAGR
jgi:RNA recognition motif-containing protein